MKTNMRILLLSFVTLVSLSTFSQNLDQFKLNADKVSKYQIFLAARHGGGEVFNQWKENNKVQYTQEMWYFSESFYVKKNAYSEGVQLDVSIIDVSRFEDQRKENEEVQIQLGGYKDAVILLPRKDLLHKCKFQQY